MSSGSGDCCDALSHAWLLMSELNVFAIVRDDGELNLRVSRKSPRQRTEVRA